MNFNGRRRRRELQGRWTPATNLNIARTFQERIRRMNINICLPPRISIFSFVLGEIYLFFSIFFLQAEQRDQESFGFIRIWFFLWRICVTINTGITIWFVYSSICKRTRKYLFRCLRIFVMITNYRTLLFKLKRINWKDVYAYKNDDSFRRIKFKDHVVSPENSFKIISSSENKIFGIIIHRPGLPFKMYQTQIRRWNIIRRERE